MAHTYIKPLGEHVPGQTSSLSLNQVKEFVAVPYHIEWYHSPQSQKVFPLILQELSDFNCTRTKVPFLIERNPYFDHAQIKYFIAYQGSKPVGRIAAFIDRNYRPETGWIGSFESIPDQDTAFMLLDAAISYLRENRCRTVIGPAKFNAAGEVGLLVDGFENKPSFMEPYHPPYYQDFFNRYGFIKKNDWYSVSTDSILSKDYMDKITRVTARINRGKRNHQSNGYHIRNIDFSQMDQEIVIIRDLYNTIWNEGHHPQQVKMTDEEFKVLALGIKEIALQDFIFIAEKDGRPIAVSVNLPDINEVISHYDSQRTPGAGTGWFNLRDLKRDLCIFLSIKKKLKTKDFDRLRLFILGIKKEYRKNGLDSRLYFSIAQKAIAANIHHGSASQLADINMDIINPIFKMGNVAMTWRVYKLDISEPG
ncbi:MAG: hypothetical protein PHN32_09130 [Actinomycetota bacterium]|nr:hypothetical protein [Actinomycetota bacterium]